jgi:membrane protease subunit (stomatin/prohibitin family)
MVYRFERYDNEIKYGAMLTVRESQTAILVNEGRVADCYEPGLYELETSNMPVMTTLNNWQHGFESPFKAEVYFFSMRRFTNLKWGTKNAIMLRDKEFGPLRLRAFGTYVFRIADPLTFIKEIVGTDGHFYTEKISLQLRNIIVASFSNIIGEADIPILDLAANYDDLSEFITQKIKPEFIAYGLELEQLLIENISLPSKVEAALDKRTSMGVIGDLRKYAQFQAAEAMEAAANNPSGAANEGIGMGIGLAVAKEMSQSFKQETTAEAVPPLPMPDAINFYFAQNGKQQGPVSKQDMQKKILRKEILPTTLIWYTGLTEWHQAGEDKEFAEVFKHMPPPLPE